MVIRLQRDEDKRATVLKREELAVVPADLNALLGRGCEFEGKLTFEGKVRIDGKFDGQIVTNDLVIIGESARVGADIACGTLISEGVIIGNVRARTAIELHPPAKVKGNINTPSLVIDKGVVFDGSSRMEDVEAEGMPATLIPVVPNPAS